MLIVGYKIATGRGRLAGDGGGGDAVGQGIPQGWWKTIADGFSRRVAAGEGGRNTSGTGEGALVDLPAQFGDEEMVIEFGRMRIGKKIVWRRQVAFFPFFYP